LLEFFDVFSMILKVIFHTYSPSVEERSPPKPKLTATPLLKNISCAFTTDYYSKVYVQTIGPLVLLALLFLCFKRTKEAYFFDLLLFVSFVVYPSSSAVLLQFFDCYSVWHGSPGTPATLYLLMDPSIKCTDPKYLTTALAYVLPMTLVFVVGFPLYYAKLVFGDKAFINPKCPNARLFHRLKNMQNKVLSSPAQLKLALGDYFGLHLEPSELDVLFSHWSHIDGSDRKGGAATPVTHARLVELFDFGRNHATWTLADAARSAMREEPSWLDDDVEEQESEYAARAAQPRPAQRLSPALLDTPPAVRELLQAHAIAAARVMDVNDKDEKESWAIGARENDDRAQRSAFLWKVSEAQHRPLRCRFR
jgi:hypothetical protein